ncbi:MAG: zf-HC2 domain-containing protein [Gallionellaceae bacterium]|jgi:predicted anti-sigma-YlaC factor YlaD
MLTCKEASQLMSQSFDRRFGLMEKAGLHLHLAICKSCRIAHGQLAFLHQLCKRMAAEPADITSLQTSLTVEAKERILKELHRKQDG